MRQLESAWCGRTDYLGTLGSSPLSALALFAFASTIHLATCEHTAVMGLQKLCSLVESIRMLLVRLFLCLDDLVEVFPSALLLDALGPLLFDLSELLELVLEVSLRLVALLVLIAHVLVIGFERLRILLVRIVIIREQSFLSESVLCLQARVILGQVIDRSLQHRHRLLMALFTGLLDRLALRHQGRLVRVLLSGEVGAGLL
mmetsp:Transcript_19502/g.26360  ORF Transcript_19502/g.26360 Transcript_19502/m.26360 type:complete len:202 (+) Transcript_19502:58-663(+)